MPSEKDSSSKPAEGATTDDEMAPDAATFTYSSRSAVFEDKDGDPLCVVSWELLDRVVTWAIGRGFGESSCATVTIAPVHVVGAIDDETVEKIREGLDALTPSGPMDPERLARLRAWMRGEEGGDMLTFTNVERLLADRDHWEAEAAAWKREAQAARELRGDMEVRMMTAQAEAQRYRSRCPVEASDVAAAGVTRAQCRAWLLSLEGVAVPDWSIDEGGDVENGLVLVWTDDGSGDTDTIYFDAGGASAIASAIDQAHPYAGDGDIAQLDILDEMAAMPGASAEGAGQ
jgi:hypothetical protein